MKKLKNLVVFDLDGTLAESKAAIDPEMGALLNSLMRLTHVAIISGGDWPQFQQQVLGQLHQRKYLKNLVILPTCGTKYYEYNAGWKLLYAENFTPAESVTIIAALQKAVAESGLKIEKTWGEQIEDRGSQITFSALGQQAPLEAKKAFDPDFAKRKIITALLHQSLSAYAVNMGGATSIDVTKLGIDKAYGIHKLHDILHIKTKRVIYIGDALFKGGNDYPATTTGVACIQVDTIQETKRGIVAIIACLNMG